MFDITRKLSPNNLHEMAKYIVRGKKNKMLSAEIFTQYSKR